MNNSVTGIMKGNFYLFAYVPGQIKSSLEKLLEFMCRGFVERGISYGEFIALTLYRYSRDVPCRLCENKHSRAKFYIPRGLSVYRNEIVGSLYLTSNPRIKRV
jgi:hypothetical protein